MIHIFVALYQEAKPVIELLKLKKSRESDIFDEFVNEELGVRLAVTGVGAMAAAVCVTRVFTVNKPDPGDILINAGSCAGEGLAGSFVLCGKIVEEATGRSFYPDLLFHHPYFYCPEATVISVPEVLTKGISEEAAERAEGYGQMRERAAAGCEEIRVYDCEAAAIYQAAAYFIAPHQMIFYKFITDAGFGNSVAPQLVEKMAWAFWRRFFSGAYQQMGKIKEMLAVLSAFSDQGKDGFEEYMSQNQRERICREFKCSETMKHDLMQNLRFYYLEKVNLQKIMEEAHKEKWIPVKDKRAGKLAMQHVLSRLREEAQKAEGHMPPFPETGYASKAFSTIYIEEDVADCITVKKILDHFSNAAKIPVRHYKDVFCRKKQSVFMQEKGKALILAKKTGNLVYQGARMCQSFKNEFFYYTSCIMNCIYNCDYCYLKGMYPSANLVVFVNLEDIFAEVDRLLALHPVYLCVSYDTDLMALESITGFVKRWVDFANSRKNLRVEIRTKCGRKDLWKSLNPISNVIFAFTLSPEPIVSRFEHGTGSLSKRLESLVEAYKAGFTVRLCFDPIIYCKNWKQAYGKMLEQVFERARPEKIMDISIGSFRISQDYLKKMRKAAPNVSVVQYPYQKKDGICQYDERLREEMEQFVLEWVRDKMPEEKIFRWEAET